MVLSREVTARIKEVLEKHPGGLSITDLVKSVDINRNTAGRYLENLLLSGQVEMRRFGMAKMYTLAKRLPVSSVLSLSSELLMQLDFSQRVFYANDTLLSFLGTPAKDLFGKNIEFTPFALVFEEVFPELLDRFRKGLKGEEWHGELSRPIKGAFFFCRVAPIVFNEGTKGVSVLFEDITDQKRDGERIRKSEARLRSIFKASPVGIGVERDRILLEVNDRLCRMTGYSERELVGKSARMLYSSEEEFARVGTRKNNQMRQSGIASVETRWIKKDGTAIDIILNTAPLDPANISGGITFTALDITERKQAEQALRESESTARGLLDAPTDSIILLDRSGVILDLNETAARGLGRKRRDLIGILSDSVLPPEIARERRKKISEVFTTKKPVRFTDEHGGIWFDNVAYPILDTTGGVARLAIMARDITDQKRAERALRESEDRYRSLSEASRDIIFVIGRDDRVEYVNSIAAVTLGIPVDRIIGQKRSVLFPGETGQNQALGLKRVFETGNPGRSEGVMQILGTLRWFDHYLMPITNTRGTVTSVLGVSRDISDRRQMETALRESEDRYRKLVEISPGAVILHRDGKIIYVNPAAVRLANAGSPGELIGRPILDIVAPEYREVVRNYISRDLTGEATPPMELRLLRVDQTPVMAEGRGVATSINGRPAVLVALNDITDRYEAALALKTSEERYRLMFENTGAATAIVEDNTIISLMNTEFERFSGYTKAEIEKKRSWTEFVVKEDLERLLAIHYQRNETGDAPRQYEFGFIRKNGEIRLVLNTVSLIPGTKRAVASLIDITDRRMADEMLVQREEQYRFIADNSLDIINRQTPECICTYVSPAITPLLGYSEIEMLGKSVLAMVHPDDLGRVQQDLLNIARGGQGHITSTFRFRHRDGHYLWFESTTKIIRDEKTGQIREFLSISRDITERKSAGEKNRPGLDKE